MSRHLSCTTLVLAAALAVLSGGAHSGPVDAEDVSDRTGLSFSADFAAKQVTISGSLENLSDKTYPCLIVVFNLKTREGWKQDAMTIKDLSPGEKKPYRQRFRAAQSVGHATTLTCAEPLTQAAAGQCIVKGELHAPRGFVVNVQDRLDAKGTPTRLSEVLLIADGSVVDHAPLNRGKTVRSFRFDAVPVGKAYVLGLSRGWAFQGFEQIEVRCKRRGQTLTVKRRDVQVVG